MAEKQVVRTGLGMANAARAPLSRSTRRADEKRFRSVRNAAGGRAVRKGGRWPPASVASSAGPPGGAREAGLGGGREGARTGAQSHRPVAPAGAARPPPGAEAFSSQLLYYTRVLVWRTTDKYGRV